MRNRGLLLLAVLVLTASPLIAQQPATTTHQTMDCQAMMQKMQTMHGSMKAMDDRLAALVNDMNKARGSAKVDRIAAVVNEMIAQRKQMHEQMSTMMPQMMGHMMQHMQSGMMSSMHSMANCPMMKGSGERTEQQEHKH